MITWNTAAFEQAIVNKANRLNIEPAKILAEEMLKLAEALVKETPPRSKSQGLNAIKRDISRAVLLLTTEHFSGMRGEERERIRLLIRRRDYAGVRAMLHNYGGWSKWEIKPFNPLMHLQARSSRGRVRGQRKIATLDKQEHGRHGKAMGERTGIAKSGWTPAILGLGGVVKQSFIARHGTRHGGLVFQGRNTAHATITIFNRSIKVPGFQQAVVNRALMIRANAINKRTQILVEKTCAS